jgi:hypothetical protein
MDSIRKNIRIEPKRIRRGDGKRDSVQFCQSCSKIEKRQKKSPTAGRAFRKLLRKKIVLTVCVLFLFFSLKTVPQ